MEQESNLRLPSVGRLLYPTKLSEVPLDIAAVEWERGGSWQAGYPLRDGAPSALAQSARAGVQSSGLNDMGVVRDWG